MIPRSLFDIPEPDDRQPDPDVAPTRAGDPGTSYAAAAEVDTRKVRMWVLAFVRAFGACTQEMADAAYLAEHPTAGDSTARGRFCQLERMGYLRRTGKTVPNERGQRAAQLWEATSKVGDASESPNESEAA
jgi:hypothetical protein